MEDNIILIKIFHELTNKYTSYDTNNMNNIEDIYSHFKIGI